MVVGSRTNEPCNIYTILQGDPGRRQKTLSQVSLTLSKKMSDVSTSTTSRRGRRSPSVYIAFGVLLSLRYTVYVSLLPDSPWSSLPPSLFFPFCFSLFLHVGVFFSSLFKPRNVRIFLSLFLFVALIPPPPPSNHAFSPFVVEEGISFKPEMQELGNAIVGLCILPFFSLSLGERPITKNEVMPNRYDIITMRSLENVEQVVWLSEEKNQVEGKLKNFWFDFFWHDTRRKKEIDWV